MAFSTIMGDPKGDTLAEIYDMVGLDLFCACDLPGVNWRHIPALHNRGYIVKSRKRVKRSKIGSDGYKGMMWATEWRITPVGKEYVQHRRTEK